MALMYDAPRLEQDEKIIPTGYTANGEGMLRYQYQVRRLRPTL
jgi:hypothetical protein